MGKFDGILLCTDLDGTLFRDDKTVSDENIEAIEYFKNEGGYFTFITGRMPFYAKYVADIVKPNAPVGCVNGGGIYDYSKGEYLWTALMPDNVTELVKCVDESFPGVGIQVNTYNRVYFCKDNETMVIYRRRTKAENIVRRYYEVEEPVAKIVFGSESEEDIDGIALMLKNHPLANEFEFIRSEKTLYEILPGGIGKGTSITNIASLLNIDINNTVAIGDYDNDISMFKSAGTGIAVANACEEAKKAADYITVSNEEHAIARVIYDIEENRYK